MINKMIMKKYNLLFIFLFSFVLFVNNVNAISFTGGKYVKYNKYFTVKEVSNNQMDSSTKIKYVKGSDNSEFAYCANRHGHFGNNSNSYNEVMAWGRAKTCHYVINNVEKTNGDCSSIVGFIINESLKKNKNKTVYQKWMYTQGAIWTYLYYYSPSPYKKNNKVTLSKENTPKVIKTIFNNAWKAYYDSVNGNPNSDTTDENVDFTVTPGTATFNYVATGNSCSTNGNYVTQDITITNNERTKIKVTVFKKDGSQICLSDGTSCLSNDYKFELSSGTSRKIYLKTNGSVKLNANALTDLNIKGEYKKNLVSNSASYDSHLYYAYDGNNEEIVDAQRIIVGTSETESANYSEKHEKIISIKLKQNYIKRDVCPSKTKEEFANAGYNVGGNTSNSAVQKKCAANISASSRAANVDDYSVGFYDCRCTSVPVSLSTGNVSVGIILEEVVDFTFGAFELENIYPGGGFGLDNKNIKTNYSGKLMWKYANRESSSNKPYYYDSANKIGYIAQDDTELKKKITDYLQGKIDNNKTIPIDTWNSNEQSKGKAETTLDIKYDDNNVSDNKRMITVKDKLIEMKKAFFSSKGNVSYAESITYSIDGGNKYYTPIDYNGNTFPFNIKVNNMSVTGEFNFYYKASCKIDVVDYDYGVLYRTVDVSDPFIKTNNIASSVNWSEWWNGNDSNQQRFKNAFSKYPDQPLYRVSIDNNLIKKYDNYETTYQERYYTSWQTVKSNGSNDFVSNSNGFVRVPSGGRTGSYCEIGKFSSSCDSVR